MAFTRQQVLDRLRKRIAEAVPIIGGGAGNGISAKCQEAGGVDLLILYNSGRFRMNGRGSLAGCMPYGASSVERLPAEVAIKEQMQKFKAISFE